MPRCCFERPQAGAITIAGRPVCDAAHWVVPEERGVGMVFQDYALFPHLTVAENVAFGLQRLEKAAAARTVAQTLDLVGLSGFEDRYPHELSGGQRGFLLGRVDNGKLHTEVGIFENVGGHPAGAAVEIMIRPDDVHIVPASPGGARIVGRQFRGSENLYSMILSSGQHLHSSESSTTVYPIGTLVDLKIVATHIVTFRKS